MVIVTDVCQELPELRPRVAPEGAHVLDRVVESCLTLQLLSFGFQMFVYQTLHIVFVTRPKTFFCIPNSIKGTSLNHQILRTSHDKVRVQLHTLTTFTGSFSRTDLIPVHQTPFT